MTQPALSVEVNQKDIDRVLKRLDKWQGAPLAKRMEKAVAGGLALLVSPIRFGAQRHRVTGATSASVKVKKLRKKPGEVFAYKVGVNTWYGHFPIGGTSQGVEADPYVDAAFDSGRDRVQSFIDEQIVRYG